MRRDETVDDVHDARWRRAALLILTNVEGSHVPSHAHVRRDCDAAVVEVRLRVPLDAARDVEHDGERAFDVTIHQVVRREARVTATSPDEAISMLAETDVSEYPSESVETVEDERWARKDDAVAVEDDGLCQHRNSLNERVDKVTPRDSPEVIAKLLYDLARSYDAETARGTILAVVRRVWQ